MVSIKQRYAGHARGAGLVATQCHGAAYPGRYTIVVGDDIDPTNLNEVLWAVCMRCDPLGGYRNPAPLLERSSGPDHSRDEKGFHSRAIIDATRRYEWKDKFPPVSRSSKELRENVLAKWADKLW